MYGEGGGDDGCFVVFYVIQYIFPFPYEEGDDMTQIRNQHRTLEFLLRSWQAYLLQQRAAVRSRGLLMAKRSSRSS